MSNKIFSALGNQPTINTTVFDLLEKNIQVPVYFRVNPVAATFYAREYDYSAFQNEFYVNGKSYAPILSTDGIRRISEYTPEMIHPECLEQADAAIEYFSQLIALRNLEGQELTSWQLALRDVLPNLHHDTSITFDELKVCCKLIDFYNEELFINELIEPCSSFSISGRKEITLKFICKQPINAKGVSSLSPISRYWCMTSDNELVGINIPSIHQLLLTSIFDKYAADESLITVSIHADTQHKNHVLSGKTYGILTTGDVEIVR